MMQSILAVLRINIMGSMMVLKLKPLNFLLALELQVLGVGTIFWDAARKTCPTSLKCQVRPGGKAEGDHAQISGIEGGQVGVVARFFGTRQQKSYDLTILT